MKKREIVYKINIYSDNFYFHLKNFFLAMINNFGSGKSYALVQ